MINAFDASTGVLHFEVKGNIDIRLEMKTNIVLINGDSATGKSFIVNSVADMKNNEEFNNMSKYSFKNIVTVQSKFELSKLEHTHEDRFLYLIDRADLIMRGRKDLSDLIYFDTTNWYIIMARSNLGLPLSPNYFAELVRKDKSITLRHYFNIANWY